MSRPRDRNCEAFTGIRKEVYNEFFENSSMEVEYYL
jgi:hypothetical protein